MGATREGQFWSFLFAVSCALIITSWVIGEGTPPEVDGEIGLFYEVQSCRSANRSFQFGLDGFVATEPACAANPSACAVWDVYKLRYVTPQTPSGLACPLIEDGDPEDEGASLASPVVITLEQQDGVGYGYGLKYDPVVMLSEGSYASISFDIVDQNGTQVLPANVVWLGPNENFPWTTDATSVTAPEPGYQPELLRPPSSPGVTVAADVLSREGCTSTAQTPSAAGCTSPGNDCCAPNAVGEVATCSGNYTPFRTGVGCSTYSEGTYVCCPPTASVSLTGRRLAETTAAATASATPLAAAKAPGRALLFGSLRMAGGEPDGDGGDGGDDEDGEAAVVVPAGARRLLKGGTSSGRASGGRSGSTGSSRWGGSSRAVTTTSYRGGGGSSTPRVYRGNTYGGSSTGYYRRSYGGRYYYYYGGYRSYRYSYAPRVFLYGAAFYTVHHYAYGCYTCATRTCYACSGCTTRKSCNAEATSVYYNNLDRYEVHLDETPFVTPAAAAWPLQLRIFNMTQFVQRAPANAAGAQPASSANVVYLSFYTAAPTGWETAGGTFATLGWIFFAISLVVLLANQKKFFPEEGSRHQTKPAVEMVTARPAPSQPYMMQAAQPYAQPQVAQPYTQPYTQAYPQAYPQPYAQPQAAFMQTVMPVATAVHPGSYPANHHLPQAVPAYPSHPPSPPAVDADAHSAAEPRSKDE